jgi:hypothetical protein
LLFLIISYHFFRALSIKTSNNIRPFAGLSLIFSHRNLVNSMTAGKEKESAVPV